MQRAPLQCPARPPTAHGDSECPDYVSVPAITPILILKWELGPWSLPGAIHGAGFCWGLYVNCVLKLLQLLETGFFVCNLHQR